MRNRATGISCSRALLIMPCLGLKGQLLRATIVPIFMRPAALCRKLQFEDSLSRRAGMGRLAGASYTYSALTIFSLIRCPG